MSLLANNTIATADLSAAAPGTLIAEYTNTQGVPVLASVTAYARGINTGSTSFVMTVRLIDFEANPVGDHVETRTLSSVTTARLNSAHHIIPALAKLQVFVKAGASDTSVPTTALILNMLGLPHLPAQGDPVAPDGVMDGALALRQLMTNLHSPAEATQTSEVRKTALGVAVQSRTVAVDAVEKTTDLGVWT